MLLAHFSNAILSNLEMILANIPLSALSYLISFKAQIPSFSSIYSWHLLLFLLPQFLYSM